MLKLKTDSWKEYVPNVMAKFDEMSPSNQQEFLNLYKNYKDETDQRNFVLKKAIVEVMEGDTEKAVKVLKVIGIYDTNSFEGGLRLKTWRFNHSCWPNAMPILNTKLE